MRDITSLFMSYNTKGAWRADHSFETSLLQATYHARSHSCAALAFRVTNVMKDSSIVFQDSECLLIKRQRIQVTGQSEHGWVMNDRRKRLRRKFLDLLKSISDDLRYFRMIE